MAPPLPLSLHCHLPQSLSANSAYDAYVAWVVDRTSLGLLFLLCECRPLANAACPSCACKAHPSPLSPCTCALLCTPACLPADNLAVILIFVLQSGYIDLFAGF